MQAWWHRNAPWYACYLAWGALSLGGLWGLLRVRELIVALFVLVGLGAKLVPVLDRFGLVAIGLLWIAGIGALEEFLRAGLQAQRLGPRIVRLAAIETGVVGFSYLLGVALGRG